MTAPDWLTQILPRLKVDCGPGTRGEYVAWCPFHPDGQGKPPHRRNLYVSKRGWYCHVCQKGGELRELARDLGIDPGSPNGDGDQRQIVKTYDYRDKSSTLLFQVVRFNPKGFKQRHPDGKSGWVWNLNGTRRVISRLPELLARPDNPVWVVEGEKDADRLAKDGLVATTNPGGAGKWRSEYAEVLRGRDVVILPDNDDPGERHAQAVARSLTGVTSSIKILHLPGLPPKGDVSDWLDAGHSTEELQKLAAATPAWNRAVEERTNLRATSDQPVREAADDPHRLARTYLAARGSDREGRIALHFWRHQWWRWNGACYRLLDKDELRAEITASIKAEFDRCTLSRQAERDARKVSHQLVTNAIQALTGMVIIPSETEQPAWLGVPERNRRYLSLSNGLFDLEGLLSGKSGELVPHSPEWFSPFHLPYAFDPAADCPLWLDFLDEVLEGEGANGKSVVCEMLTALLGEHNVAHVPLELFGQRFQLTMTLGKLANIAAEVGDLDKAAEGVLKAFTAGDRMDFDRKGIPGIEAYPTARLVLATNNRPRFSDRSSGLWRRMLLLPFRLSIPEERQDHHLAAKLKPELPGSLLLGCCRPLPTSPKRPLHQFGSLRGGPGGVSR